MDHLQRWSRIFRSEETETDLSIWIPTEISGIFGIMESTQSFRNLILLLCKTWATISHCFVHQHGRLITWVKTKNSFSDLAAFLSAPPSNFPAKAEESSRCQLVADQTSVCMASGKQEHIGQITERCLIAQKKFRFKERAGKYCCKRCRRVNRQFSAPSLWVFVFDLCLENYFNENSRVTCNKHFTA